MKSGMLEEYIELKMFYKSYCKFYKKTKKIVKMLQVFYVTYSIIKNRIDI